MVLVIAAWIEQFTLDCRKGLVLVWFWFYYALWLASVFIFVLVLRQSSENRSNQLVCFLTFCMGNSLA